LINMANPAEIRRIADEARGGAAEAGKDPAALEIICKVRCSVAEDHGRARDALGRLLTYYALADYYRDLFGRMGFAAEVELLRAAWQRSGFHAARAAITDRFFDGAPVIAAASIREVRHKLRPYEEAGATRVILPYVPASEHPVEEIKNFISAWDSAE